MSKPAKGNDGRDDERAWREVRVESPYGSVTTGKGDVARRA